MLSDKEIQDLFRQEATERVESIESTLFLLETSDNPDETMNDLFRTLHTLKGSGNMAGFLTLGAYVHELETKLVVFKTGKQKPGTQFVAEFLAVCDILKEMINSPPDQPFPGSAMVAQFHGKDGPRAVKNPVPEARPQSAKLTERPLYIKLVPAPTLFQEGISAAALFASLEALGPLKREANLDMLATLPGLDPESCWLAWDLELQTSATISEVEELFAFLPHGSFLQVSEKALRPLNHGAVAPQEAKGPSTKGLGLRPSEQAPPSITTKDRRKGAIRGLLCRIGEVPVLVPSTGIRACRPPETAIQRPLGICEIDGAQETVIDLPTLFDSSSSEERVLVLLEHRNQNFAIAVESFEDFMDGEIQSGGIPIVSSQGTDGFILDPDGSPVLILDMDWFATILNKQRS